MKKKMIALILVCCMAAALAACGKGGNPAPSNGPSQDTTQPSGQSQPSETPAEPEKVSLTVWSPSEDQNPDLGAWLNTMCDKFNELHPEWDITFNYGVCTESEAKSLVPQDVDKAADVFVFSSTGLENLCQANAITEWGGSYLQSVADNYPKSLVDTLYYNGGLFGVPITTNTYFMYYDKSVYSEEDVKSLDTMLEKGKVAYPLNDGYYLAAMYLAANDGAFFGPAGDDREAGITLNDAAAVSVTNTLVDLVADPNFIVASPSDAIAMMREGNCNAYVCGTWQAAQTEEVLGDNYGVAMLPTVKIDGVDTQIRPFTSSKAMGVKSTTQYPEVALNLALYLAGYDSQKYHYETRGYVPCENTLVAEVQNDVICRVDSATVSQIAVPRGSFTEMSFFWTPAESMGNELRDGTVTHDNAVEKTEAFHTAANTSGVN